MLRMMSYSTVRCRTPEPTEAKTTSPPGAPMKRRKCDPEPSPLLLPPTTVDLERLAVQRDRIATGLTLAFGKMAEDELPALLRLVRLKMEESGVDASFVKEPRGLCLNDMGLPEQAYALDALTDRVKMMAMSFEVAEGEALDGELHCLAGEGARNAYILVHCILWDLRAVRKFYSREYPLESVLQSLTELEVCLELMKVELLANEDVMLSAEQSSGDVLYVREPEPGMENEESRDAPTAFYAGEESRDALTALWVAAETPADAAGKDKDARLLATLGITPSPVALSGDAGVDFPLKETYMALRLVGARVAGVYSAIEQAMVREGHDIGVVKGLVEAGPEVEAMAFPGKEPGPVVVDRKTWVDKDTSGFARLRYVAKFMKDLHAMVEEDVATGAICAAPVTPELDLTEMYRHQLWTKLVVIQTSARMGETDAEHSAALDDFSRAYLRLAVAFQDLELGIFKKREAAAGCAAAGCAAAGGA